ncbi:hypothetical protein KKG90_00220 [Candidatus Bipolaricaulota bacterium]|nr:hypothetical protein [Candidatus Bipolaricaulota bacterium]
MLQMVLQSFVRGEVTVGIVLTLLLISGRSDAQTLAFSLGGIGVFLLLQGLVPLSSGASRRSKPAPRPSSKPMNPSEPTDAKAEPALETTLSSCACARRPFNRREYFIRAACSSLVVVATACLIYWLTPSVISI